MRKTPRKKVRYGKGPHRFTVVLRPEAEGGFTAMVPALPGCVTYGRTLAEAKAMAKDAMSGYIESLRKHGEPVPSDDKTVVASVELEYAEASGR
jgi:antitoxin HicB